LTCLLWKEINCSLSLTFSTKTSILQASLPVVQDGETIDDSKDILTKENKDVNVWDEEW